MPAPKEHIQLIKQHFSHLIGCKLNRCETAELFFEESNEWDEWNDLPVRLYFSSKNVASVSWSKFDELEIKNDLTNPGWLTNPHEVRWVENTIDNIELVLNSELLRVELGEGDFTLEERKIEIWTRLLLVFENGHLEIMNALDENGFQVHTNYPKGEFVACA